MKRLTENLGGGRWRAAIGCVSHRPSRREELLYGLQRLVHERVMFVPVYEERRAHRRWSTRGRAGPGLDLPEPVVRTIRGGVAQTVRQEVSMRRRYPHPSVLSVREGARRATWRESANFWRTAFEDCPICNCTLK